jgi:hypothetical protein
MKSVLALLAATALLGAAGCALSGQKQTAEGAVQMPGERHAPSRLNIPPDEWAGPGRPAQTASAQ